MVSADRGLSGVRPRRFLASKGYIWVELFFALSGFILFYAYGSRFGVGLKAEAIGTFLAARVSRLYPLQLATLLAVVILEIDRRIVGTRELNVSFSMCRPLGGEERAPF
jgi:peptidoglycan/LPS O-acetylase OafA/YrhL